jgi:murein DD-endopeptidase MepM/ murein hydrolase activator NlpD
MIGSGLLAVVRSISVPVRFVGKLIFLLVFVNAYKFYLLTKHRVAAVWRPAKNRILFPLSTRYVIHVVIILLTIVVTTQSLKARDAKNGDAAAPILLSSLLQTDGDEDIVETADMIFLHKDYFEGIGGVSPLDVSPVDIETEIAATQEGSSVLKPNLASTTVGERPREGVITHSVLGGETVSTIAEAYRVSINTILWENRLGAKDYIKPGQQLTILPITGVSHQVKSGDTIASIAKKYQADESEIVTFNKLADASAIVQDQILLVPNGKIPPPPTPVIRYAQSNQYDANPPPGIRATGSGFVWPTPSRKINQYFTYRHRAIDIDGSYSSPIYAADGGRVEFVGWGGGYGLHVVVNHGGGVKTLYAHASKTFVKAGETVNKGQTIAKQGSTGWSTGVHLHFEVFINGGKVNPFSYF